MYTVMVAMDVHVNIEIDVCTQRTLTQYTVRHNTLMPYNTVHVVSVLMLLKLLQ
jgi:hypothetical protein